MPAKKDVSGKQSSDKFVTVLYRRNFLALTAELRNRLKKNNAPRLYFVLL
jgi:hypothetical protein